MLRLIDYMSDAELITVALDLMDMYMLGLEPEDARLATELADELGRRNTLAKET